MNLEAGSKLGPYEILAPIGAGGSSTVYVGRLDSKDLVELPGIHSQAIYSPTGHILFVLGLTLMAQPFDAKRLQLNGEAFPIAEQITSVPGGMGEVCRARYLRVGRDRILRNECSRQGIYRRIR